MLSSSANASQATLVMADEEKGSVELELNTTHSHTVKPPTVTPFGVSSPGDGDTTGLPAPLSLEDALAEQAELDRRDREREKLGEPDWEVRFEPGDMENPLNWSNKFKWYLTGLGGLLVLNSTFSSSAPSGVLPQMATDLGMSSEVSVLVISLFVAGYVVGPLAWGPLSGVYGRRPMILISFVAYVVFQLGSIFAPNTAAVLVFRFLGGVTASAPLVVTPALLGDLFSPEVRGMAIAIFVVAPFLGPALAPICSGFMEDSGVHWRWLFVVLCVFAAVCGIAAFFTLPETYGPVLLVRKAERMRKETGQPWFAPLEKQSTGLTTRLNDVCVRPFVMLVEEPMLLAITIFMSVIYGILYLSFVAYPIIFQQGHGFKAGPAGLMFLPIMVGSILAALVSAFYYNPRYIKAAAAYAPSDAPPELRLEGALVGAVLLPIAMFWLGFTSYESIHWAVPMMSGLFLGASLIFLFLSLMNYIVDSYIFASATALAVNTVARSAFGAIFPLFGKQMYAALTAPFAGLVLGLVCIVLMPIPFIFIRFGPAIRARSKHAAVAK